MQMRDEMQSLGSMSNLSAHFYRFDRNLLNWRNWLSSAVNHQSLITPVVYSVSCVTEMCMAVGEKEVGKKPSLARVWN